LGNEIFRKDNYPFFIGKINKTEFLKQNISSYPIAFEANKILSKNDKILSLGESRGFYFDAQFIPGFGYIASSIFRNTSADGIIAEMKKNGIHYVLFSNEPYFHDLQPTVFNETKLLSTHFSLIAKEGNFFLYKMISS
jgi:hypothetical protein